MSKMQWTLSQKKHHGSVPSDFFSGNIMIYLKNRLKEIIERYVIENLGILNHR